MESNLIQEYVYKLIQEMQFILDLNIYIIVKDGGITNQILCDVHYVLNLCLCFTLLEYRINEGRICWKHVNRIIDQAALK